MAILKRITATLTVVAITLSATAVCFAQSYNTIKITSQNALPVTHGNEVTYTQIEGTYTNGSNTYNEKAYALSFKQSTFAKLDVTSGSSLYGRKNLSSLISQYKAPDGYRVVGAINGDFFSGSTGLALGVEVSNGVLKSSNNHTYENSVGRYTLGFKADGSAVVGIPNLTLNVTAGKTKVTADRVNAYPDTNFVILTDSYGAKTYWSSLSHDVIELKANDTLGIGKITSFSYVASYMNITEPINIQKGHFYLVAPKGDSRIAQLLTSLALTPNGTVGVRDNTGGWTEVVTAIGGGNLLINQGEMRYPSTYDSSISNTMTSRTAVGIKKDGTAVFYCVEKSSKSGSAGVPIEAVTQALYDMGCVYAINFDGGGSSTVACAQNGGEVSLRNSPQDGTQRNIANCILIIARDYPPEIITDFEQPVETVEVYEGKNLLKVSANSENSAFGKSALRADYTLAGFKNKVEFNFKTPFDVSKYDNITLWLNSTESNTPLSIILEVDGKWERRKITNLNFDEYTRFTVDTSDASKIIGFELSYEIASDNSGSVIIDRIVGYYGGVLEDSVAPTLTVTETGKTLNATAVDNEYPTLANVVGYEFTFDGVPAEYTVTNNVAVANKSALVGNKIVKAVTSAYDIAGNRTQRISIIKTSDYTKTTPFADVSAGWDEMYILYCAQNGIINGISENNKLFFKGTSNITRAEFCTMLVRQAGIDPDAYVNVVLPYSDIGTIPAWAMPYIKAAYKTGIMTGNGTAFNANANITRQEAACAIDRVNTDDLRLASAFSYSDMKEVSNWAKESVISLSKQSIMSGDSDGKFHPLRTLTRSECAAMLTRI